MAILRWRQRRLAFSVAVALVLVLPARLRPAAAVFGVGYASVTAFATLSAGWHRPSDSLAAFLVVGAWAAGAEAVVMGWSRSAASGQPSVGQGHRATSRRLAIAAAYMLAFGAIVASVIVTTQLDSYGGAAEVLAYVAAAAAISGTAAALMAAFIAVLADVVCPVNHDSVRQGRLTSQRLSEALSDRVVTGSGVDRLTSNSKRSRWR